MNTLRYCSGVGSSHELYSIRRKKYLSPLKFWIEEMSLREVDKNFPFGGTFGCKDSCLDSIWNCCKLFTLHANKHDAARAARADHGNGPGCWYMIRRGTFSLSFVTWQQYSSLITNWSSCLPFPFLSCFNAVHLGLCLTLSMQTKNCRRNRKIYNGKMQGNSIRPQKE